jgi:hypothetical protein
MSKRAIVVVSLAGLVVVAAAFVLGRSTVSSAPPPAAASLSGYTDGFEAGRAAGIQEGRALQAGQALTGAERDTATAAFNAGYRAGVNDVFGGYDGGWSTGVPYAVTLVGGTGGATYRISSRVELRPGVDYFLCPDHKTLCQAPDATRGTPH